jgi:phasin protein
MAGKASDAPGSPASKSGPTPFFELGKERTEAMTALQKDLLEAYEQTSSAWLARVKSEVDLWSELATKLTATRSAPEAMEAYRDCVAQRMQMAADDGRRMSEDCQKIMQKITRSFSSNGWPTGST